jgi:hypothetical protein
MVIILLLLDAQSTPKKIGRPPGKKSEKTPEVQTHRRLNSMLP